MTAGAPSSRVGILCPAGPDDVPPGVFARKAESLGFESLWVGEHPAIPQRIDRSYTQLEDGEVSFRNNANTNG